MLFQLTEAGDLKKIQLSSHPQAALFSQQFSEGDDSVVIRYHTPAEPLVPAAPAHSEPLFIPLDPHLASLTRTDINLHGSPTACYRMGEPYDAWFSACFGFPTVLVFIGDGRRPVLGTMEPPLKQGFERHIPFMGIALFLAYVVFEAVGVEVVAMAVRDWKSPLIIGLLAMVLGLPLLSPIWKAGPSKTPGLAFADCAPLMVASDASLKEVATRFQENSVPMYKFRPNLVVDGEDAWSEDLWGDLVLSRGRRLLLTSNCVRCVSLNVDYETGKPADGELGTVLKKLMKDRRVDKGAKWSPVFGRYAFLMGREELEIHVDDEINVGQRMSERWVWDWPHLS